jgi:hypothetical protein
LQRGDCLAWASFPEVWSWEAKFEDVPVWLVGSNWAFTGQCAVWKTGLILDLAAALGLVIVTATVCEWARRRRWRYSLRSALGVFVLISVALGWWLGTRDGCNREIRAVAGLRAKGCEITRSCNAPVWLRMLVGASYLSSFTHVASIHTTFHDPDREDNALTLSQIDDDDVECLREVRHLRHLYLNGTAITDDGLRHIGRLTELEGLSLIESTQITDAGLEQLKGLNRLQLLDLEGTQITDEAVVDFKQGNRSHAGEQGRG